VTGSRSSAAACEKVRRRAGEEPGEDPGQGIDERKADGVDSSTAEVDAERGGWEMEEVVIGRWNWMVVDGCGVEFGKEGEDNSDGMGLSWAGLGWPPAPR